MEALPLVTFYIYFIGPPPQPSTPRRGHWGHPGNCHEQSSPKKVYTHYITYCSTSTGSGEEVWNLQSFGPWGPPPGPPWWQHVPYEHLWIPGPWGWFLPSLVKIQPCISSRSRWTVTFYIGPPPQPVGPLPNLLPHMGPLGPPWEVPPTTFILHLKRYLHFTQLDCST